MLSFRGEHILYYVIFGIKSARRSCSQFTNAVYVLAADSKNMAAVYIYDATAKSWSTQSVNADKFDPTDFGAILDHDTNVFCGLSPYFVLFSHSY